MKHKLLSLIALTGAMFMSASAWAYDEPEEVEPAYTTDWAAPVNGGVYFLYNVGADQYLGAGNNWGTHVVTATVSDDASTQLFFWDAGMGLGGGQNDMNVCVGVFPIILTENEDGTFYIEHLGTDRANRYLTSEDGNSWIDGDKNRSMTFKIVAVEGGYTIQATNTEEAGTFFGAQDPEEEIEEGMEMTIVRNVMNNLSKEDNIVWRFAPTNYVQCQAYEARVALYEVLVEADDYGVDNTAAIEVYENEDATKEQLEAATSALKVEVNRAKFADEFSGATPAEPLEVTDFCLVNPAFEEGNISGWVCTFQSGVNATNVGYSNWQPTMSDGRPGYLNNGQTLTSAGSTTNDDGERSFISNFIEAWKDNNDPWAIGDATLEQTIYGLPTGMYKLTCDVISTHQHGKFENPVTGVKLFIATDNGQEVFQEVATRDGVPEHFSVTFTCPEGVNALTFGLKTESTTANWIAADNFRVYYYGDTGQTLAQFTLSQAIADAEKFLEEEQNIDFSEKAVYDAFVEAIEAGKPLAESGSDEECEAQLATLTAAQAALKASIAQYQEMDDFLQDAGEYSEKGFSYYEDVTADWDEINDALYDLKEKLEEGLDARTLTAEDYEEFHSYISNLINDIREMIKAGGIDPGQDVTILLDNADFSEGNGGRGLTGTAVPGWEIEGSLTEHRIQTGNIETWHSNFNIHQTITNMPAGVYDITVQGFVRHDDASVTNQTIFYAGDSQPALMQCSDQWSEEPIFDLQSGKESLGDSNYDATNANGYQCNGMTGAYYWFQTPNPNGAEMNYKGWKEGDNYYTNHIKVVLKQAGDLTIGIKCDAGENGSPSDWIIWDNFQITYIGEDMEAFEQLLEDSWTAAQNAYDNCEQETGMITVENENNFKAVSDFMTDKGYGNYETGDEFIAKIEEVDALTAALQENTTKAQAWMATYSEYQMKYEDLELTIDPFFLDESELYAAFGDYMIEADPEDDSIEYANNDTFDELSADLIAKWDEMMAEIADIMMQEASEENPVDVTAAYIKNADFESLNADHWTIAADEEGGRIGANQGFQNNTTYTNGNVTLANFLEAWRSGAILSNGRITQNIGVLPEGTYRLEVDAQALWQGDAVPEGGIQGAYLVAYVGEDELSTSIGIENTTAAPEHFELYFYSDGEVETTVGLLVFNTNANWMAADNFQLFFLGKDTLTGVESVKTQNVAAKAIFSIDGRQQGQLRRGINIVRMADGSVSKVLVK